MGDYSYIGPHTRVTHADIGKYCSVAGDSIIGMGTHTMDYLSTSPIFTEAKNGTTHCWVNKSKNNPYNRVAIGNDVWIGTRVMIMGGVSVGDGAVIGAGSIVTKDVSPFTIVAGVPAKVIRNRFPDEVIVRLNEIHWWNLPENKLRDNIVFFQQNNIDVQLLETLEKTTK